MNDLVTFCLKRSHRAVASGAQFFGPADQIRNHQTVKARMFANSLNGDNADKPAVRNIQTIGNF
jgi:hypothetical protein